MASDKRHILPQPSLHPALIKTCFLLALAEAICAVVTLRGSPAENCIGVRWSMGPMPEEAEPMVTAMLAAVGMGMRV